MAGGVAGSLPDADEAVGARQVVLAVVVPGDSLPSASLVLCFPLTSEGLRGSAFLRFSQVWQGLLRPINRLGSFLIECLS